MQLSIRNKDIIKLAAPISLALLLPQVTFLTDTIFLGQLGERELGVNGVTGIYYMLVSMIGYGLSNGIQVQMSRRAGENDKVALARTFTNGIMLCLVLSIVLVLLSLWLTPLIFSQGLHNEQNAILSIEFLSIRILGLPFLILTQLANSFYIATSQSKYLIHGSVASTIVNIVLDYMLIFGKGGLPEMGLMGAAVATVISEVVFCIVMYGIFYAKKMQSSFPIFSTSKFDYKLARTSLVIASPLIVQFLFSMGGWQIFFIYVEHLGTRELAISQILRSVFGLVGIGLWALASSCNTMVSNVIGQRKQRLVIPVILRIAKIAVIYASALGLILIVFPESFLSLYRNDPDLVAYAVPSLRIVAVSSVVMATASVLFNGVMGTGNTKVNLFIEMFCVSCYVLYIYIVVEQMRLSLAWAWASEYVYWGTLVITCGIYLRSGRWKNKAV